MLVQVTEGQKGDAKGSAYLKSEKELTKYRPSSQRKEGHNY